MKKPIVLIIPLLAASFLSACEQKVYKVTFDTDGGSTITEQEVAREHKVTKPEDPTKTGYDFVNWTYNDTEWNFDKDRVKEDITLKANYTLHNYTVTFKNVDGAVLQTQDNLHYGDTVTYTGTEPTYPNPEAPYTYTFNGWDKALTVNDDMVFTAVFNRRNKNYHDKYVDYDGTVLYEIYTDDINDLTGYPNETPKEAVHDNVNYRFLGWEKEDKGNGETVYTAKYDRCSIGLKFKRNVVIGYEGDAEVIYVPELWNGYKIDIIGKKAFLDNTKLKAIELPEGIDDVYYQAFMGCTSLTSVEFKEGLHFLETESFKGCSELKTVTLPNSTILIPNNAFTDCPKLEFNVYENGAYLGNSSNPYLVLTRIIDTSLTTFVMHEKSEVIAGAAFVGYTQLENITVSSAIRKIGQDGFNNCHKLKCTEAEGARYIGNKSNPYLVLVNGDYATSCNVKDGCKVIDDEAFRGRKSLKEVTFPNSLVNIGFMAFADCTSLEAIDIPASVTSIDGICFSGCSKLETVTLHDGLIYIEPSSFSSCTSLKEIVIPDSVIYVGAAFSFCNALESITLPNKITAIYEGSFQGCISLKDITIPEGVVSIEKRAFANCRSLQTVYIPSSVEELQAELFNYINGTVTIKYAGTEEQWNAIEKDTDWNKGVGIISIRYSDSPTTWNDIYQNQNNN